MTKDDFGKFWLEIMTRLKEDLGSLIFDVWISPINLKEVHSFDNITIEVPHQHFKGELEKNGYLEKVKYYFSEFTGENLNINVVFTDNNSIISHFRPSDINSSKKVDNSRDEIKENGQGSVGERVNTFKRYLNASTEGMFNLSYTFENFVVGDSNKFAYNAALSIAEKPGIAYNPCLIYGGVGLGKTHLMQSIGNYIKKKNPNANIIYITAENFVNEFLSSLKAKDYYPMAMNDFKEKYRKTDMLLIDDIHDLMGKKDTQEELFHTFNALYDSKKQLVFTCDRPPNELKNFTDRLRNRFERGLNVDLQTPNWETRYAILKRKLETIGGNVNIPDEVLKLIAEQVSTNIRDLESAILRLKGYAELMNEDITIDSAQEQLRYIFQIPAKKNITIERVQKAVSDYFNISINDLKSKKRTQSVVYPRQIAMYIIRKKTKNSTTEIGTEFGDRDHTTVMHAVAKIEDEIKTSSQLDSLVRGIISSLEDG